VNLTWHIVRKDLRRFAWPVAAWLGLSGIAAAGMGMSAWVPEKVLMAEAAEWLRGLRSSMMLVAVVGTSAVVLLAGALVHEDRVVGSTSFWLTRPMAGGRLLRAKLLAALLLLVVAPALAGVPLWWWAGFSGEEVGRALLGSLQGSAAFALVAVALAALTANIGQFAFAALTTGGLTTLVLLVLPSVWERGLGFDEALATQAWVVLGSALAFAVGVLIWQYRTRRTRVGWAVWLIALGWVAVVRLFWVWDLNGVIERGAASATERQAEVAVRADRIQSESAAVRTWEMALAVVGKAGEYVAPVEGRGEVRSSSGTQEVTLRRGKHWAFQAAAQVVKGAGSQVGPTWEVAVTNIMAKPAGGATAPDFSGRVHFARLQGMVLYELPWRAGAEAASGGTRTRLIGADESHAPTMLAEERGAAGAGALLATTLRRVDLFVLRHRASGKVVRVETRQEQPVGASGMLLGIVALTPDSIGESDPGEWSLAKVRFEATGGFERDFARLAIGPLTKEPRE
jgi:hypothetical protein